MKIPRQRKIFYIDVGDMSPTQAKEFLERIKREMRKTPEPKSNWT